MNCMAGVVAANIYSTKFPMDPCLPCFQAVLMPCYSSSVRDIPL